MFVPIQRTPGRMSKLPSHIESPSRQRLEAWIIARDNNDPHMWTRFHILNEKYSFRLRKFQSYVERKVIESVDKSSY